MDDAILFLFSLPGYHAEVCLETFKTFSANKARFEVPGLLVLKLLNITAYSVKNIY
jgi:hypothetical protein